MWGREWSRDSSELLISVVSFSRPYPIFIIETRSKTREYDKGTSVSRRYIDLKSDGSPVLTLDALSGSPLCSRHISEVRDRLVWGRRRKSERKKGKDKSNLCPVVDLKHYSISEFFDEEVNVYKSSAFSLEMSLVGKHPSHVVGVESRSAKRVPILWRD